jgi:Trk-type K+ transport system membrane component
MIVFTIISTMLAAACVFAMYLDGKIQKHIFIHHPKLWKSFGYPSSSLWFAGAYAADYAEYSLAECKLVAFVKSANCEAFGDVELLRLKAFNKLVHQIVMFFFVCVLVVGYITFLA